MASTALRNTALVVLGAVVAGLAVLAGCTIAPTSPALQADAMVPLLPVQDFVTEPTLAISAQDDYYETYESARFIGYPNGGHLLVGHGQEAMAEITRFLKAQQK